MESETSTIASAASPWSFRLWHLFVLTMAVAVWFALARDFPNLAITIGVSIVPGVFSYAVLGIVRFRRVECLSNFKKVVLGTALSCLWFVLYVLSIGPVVAIIQATGADEVAARVFYGPVIWLHDYTILEHPLEWYVLLWGS